jgi:hypothetical protein
MAEFNIDDVISGFEGKSASKAKSSALDIDSLLSGFKSSEPVVVEAPKQKAINTEPKPPISGLSKESSDEINSQRASKGGANPRRMLPTTNIQESMANAGIAAKDLLGEAAIDATTGHPYKALGKGLLGIISAAASPVSGAIEGGFGTPLTDITGNKSFGDRAALLANTAVPIIPSANTISKVSAALPILNRLSNYKKNKAFSDLVESIGSENLPMVVREMRNNPRLAPADLSPSVLQDTQSLFVKDVAPETVNYLKNTSAARMGSSKDAIDMAYDTSTGVSVDLAKKMDDLAKAARKVGDDQINPLIKNAKPVNVNKTLEEIDAVLKPGVMAKVTSESELPLTSVKKELAQVRAFLANKSEMRTDADQLNRFQSNLRVTAENLLKSTDGQSKNLGNQLLKVRKNLIDDIDAATPGYKNALSAYRDEKNIADAFKEGYDGLFSSSKKMENTPSFVKKWFDGLSDAEKQAAREGARASIATEIGVARNPALAGERLSRSDFNQEKLRILFGEEEANKLIKALADERKIADTHNKVIENSQTAMRTASKEKFALPTKQEIGQGLVVGAGLETANILAHGYPGIGTAMLTGAKVANDLKHAISTKIARERNAQYAKYALPTEGPSRDELIRALEAAIPKPKLNLMSKARLALPSP